MFLQSHRDSLAREVLASKREDPSGIRSTHMKRLGVVAHTCPFRSWELGWEIPGVHRPAGVGRMVNSRFSEGSWSKMK